MRYLLYIFFSFWFSAVPFRWHRQQLSWPRCFMCTQNCRRQSHANAGNDIYIPTALNTHTRRTSTLYGCTLLWFAMSMYGEAPINHYFSPSFLRLLCTVQVHLWVLRFLIEHAMTNICKARFNGTAITFPFGGSAWHSRWIIIRPGFFALCSSIYFVRAHVLPDRRIAVATAMTVICSKAIKIP